MFTITRRKLLAKAFINYSVVGLAALVVSQLPFLGTVKFSLLNFVGGVVFAFSWLLLAFWIEPEKGGDFDGR